MGQAELINWIKNTFFTASNQIPWTQMLYMQPTHEPIITHVSRETEGEEREKGCIYIDVCVLCIYIYFSVCIAN